MAIKATKCFWLLIVKSKFTDMNTTMVGLDNNNTWNNAWT